MIMKNTLYTLIIVFFLCESVNAQGKIQGTVLEKTNVPASFATVALLEKKDSSIIKGRAADENGTFFFEKIPVGTYLIAITHMGFKKKITEEIIISDTSLEVTLPNVILQEASRELNEVIVKSQKPLVEKASDRLIINVENSVLTTGNNALEVLKSAPGIIMTPQGQLSMRGKPNVMIMVDNKIVSKEIGNTLLENMQGDNIVKIELITNPSAKYDAQASGGIINIITRKGLQQGLNGNVRIGGSQGELGKMNAGIDFNYRKDNINIFGGLGFRHSKGFRVESNDTKYLQSTSGEIKEAVSNSFSNSNVSSPQIGIDYAINKNHSLGLLVEGNFVNYNSRIDGDLSFRSNNRNLDSSLVSTGNPNGNNRLLNYNAIYKGKLDSLGKEITVSSTYLDYNGNSFQSFTSQTFLPDRRPYGSLYQFRTLTPSEIKVFTFQTDYVQPISPTAKLEVGLRYANTRSDNKNTQESLQESTWKTVGIYQTNYLEDVLAGYLNFSKKFNTVDVQVGLRTENTKANLKTFVDTTYLNFFPSVSFEKRFANENSLSFSYSRRIDRPAYQDMIPFTVIYDKYTANRGNSRLKPQLSNVFELTAAIKSWVVALSHTQITAPITEFGEVNYEKRTFTTTVINFDNQNITSLNITIPLTITAWWQSNNSLLGTYNDLLLKNYLGSNYNAKWFACNLNTINSFKLSKGFSAELIAYYQSAQTDGLYNISAMGSVDIGLKKSFLDKNATVQLTIKDLFYTQPYHLGINYQTIDTYGYNRSDTRRIGLNFTYKFGKKTVKRSNGIEQKNETETSRLKF
jgi:outer membrane receptor protein involved in Fe transport